MSQRLTDEFAIWFHAAFGTYSLGERISWDMVFAVRTDQQGRQSPWVFLYSQIASPVLGANGVIMNLAEIPTLGLTEEVADRYVQEVVAALLKARTEALATTNGGGVPKGPLVLPK